MVQDKMMRSAGKVGLAVMVSRILGLVRDQVFAHYFGAGKLMDCYQAAFRIPNLLRDLFAEGALSSAFVTVFARQRKQQGDSRAWELARLMMTFQGVLLSVLVILGIIFSPQIVGVIAHGFAEIPGKMELTIQLTRVLFPFILLVGLAAVAMGILNSFSRFGLPASASSFFNLGSVIVGLGLALWFDPSFGATAMVCMAIGSVAGGFLQWAVQMPALFKLGFRYRPAWNLQDPGFRDILRLMVPTMIGASAVQVNVVINTIFASTMGDGPTSWLALAFRLIQLPIGLFGVALSTAALPSLAVEAGHSDLSAFKDRMERSLRMNAALCIPSACGLIILGVPLIGLLFEHGGKFQHSDTLATARVLGCFGIGLIGYASIKVLSPAYYALNRTRTPMVISFLSIGITLGLNFLFVRYWDFGAPGLALATSFSALFSAGVLLVGLVRIMGPLQSATILALVKMTLAAAGMSLAIWGCLQGLERVDLPGGILGNLVRVMVGIGVGGGVYFLLAAMMGVDEARDVRASITRRLIGNSK